MTGSILKVRQTVINKTMEQHLFIISRKPTNKATSEISAMREENRLRQCGGSRHWEHVQYQLRWG